MKTKRVLRYSIQLSMLKRLLDKQLISDSEYKKIKSRLMRDYNIVSNIMA